MSLDGTWRFKLVDSPRAAPDDFAAVDHDDSNWVDIHVPGTWVRQGHDRPHYTNVVMPFQCEPPFTPEHNPTGLYRRTFALPAQWREPARRASRRFGRQRAARVRQRRVRRAVERFAAAGGVRSNAALEARHERAGRDGHPLVRRELHRRPGPMVAAGLPPQRRVCTARRLHTSRICASRRGSPTI